jgi:hypothetical protein
VSGESVSQVAAGTASVCATTVWPCIAFAFVGHSEVCLAFGLVVDLFLGLEEHNDGVPFPYSGEPREPSVQMGSYNCLLNSEIVPCCKDFSEPKKAQRGGPFIELRIEGVEFAVKKWLG